MVTRVPKESTTLSPEEQYAARVSAEESILLEVLNTYEGRHVLYNVIARGDIYDLDGSMPTEPGPAQRCLGRREVALEVLKDALTVLPDVYILMQKEAGEFEKKFAVDTGSNEGEDDG